MQITVSEKNTSLLHPWIIYDLKKFYESGLNQ